MTSLELTPEQATCGYRPLAGRILLELEPSGEKVGSIHIPQTAQTQSPEHDQSIIGRVLAIGYGPYVEAGEWYLGIAVGDVLVGDRVLINPLLKDLNKKILLTAVTRIDAVITDG